MSDINTKSSTTSVNIPKPKLGLFDSAFYILGTIGMLVCIVFLFITTYGEEKGITRDIAWLTFAGGYLFAWTCVYSIRISRVEKALGWNRTTRSVDTPK